MARILVIDDEHDIIRLVTKTMEAHGHQVATALSGEEALDMVRHDLPDLVIVDLDLPLVSGLEVCRQLKSEPATRHVPVVMMTTAYVSLPDVKRAAAAGASEYICKPFMSEILVHNVQRLLGLS